MRSMLVKVPRWFLPLAKVIRLRAARRIKRVFSQINKESVENSKLIQGQNDLRNK